MINSCDPGQGEQRLLTCDTSQLFPEIKVMPEEDLYQLSSCGCPLQFLFFPLKVWRMPGLNLGDRESGGSFE